MPQLRQFAAVTCTLFAMASSAHAAVDLIATGQLSGTISDRSKETAAPLENGAPGNLLGGIGSGMSYAGCGIFVAVPDRGPNAIPYNSAIDDTASYINRFQTLRLHLRAAPQNAPLPFTLDPELLATTLLQTSDRLVYGNGAAAGVPNGAPKLNKTNHTNYFTGRSDNFDPTHLSTDPLDARFDPESIRVANDGDTVYISDEYGPYIYRFDRRTGRRIDVIKVPDSFAVSTLSRSATTRSA
jgi:Esterase-like activity of phytase